MKSLGTILQTKQSMAIGDAHADRMAKGRERIAGKELAGCERRIVGGEVRYYDTQDQYAIVARSGKVLWFAVMADGDKRI